MKRVGGSHRKKARPRHNTLAEPMPKLRKKPKGPAITRSARSHWTNRGKPKVSYLTRESADRRRAELIDASVYQCDELGCFHVGSNLRG